MYHTTHPSLPVTGESSMAPVREKAFFLPADDASPSVYITAVKEDAPFDNFTLGAINFEKYVLPSAASLRSGNEGKVFYPQYLTKLLTQKQVNALKTEAEKRTIFIREIKNKDFDPDQPVSPENPRTVPGDHFRMSDYMILEPEATFDPRQQPKAYKPPTPEPITPESLKNELIEQQKGKGVKK